MFRFEKRCLGRLILVLATCAGVLLASPSAFADGLIGKRLFPSTLAIDDPFVADEVGITGVHTGTGDSGPLPGSRLTGIDGRHSKRITEDLGISIGDGLRHLDRRHAGSVIGGRNPDAEVKYELIESAEQ